MYGMEINQKWFFTQIMKYHEMKYMWKVFSLYPQKALNIDDINRRIICRF